MIPLPLLLIIVLVSGGLVGGMAYLLYRFEPFRELCKMICFAVGAITICCYTGSWLGHLIYSFSKSIGVL